MNQKTATIGFLLCVLAGMTMMWSLDRSGYARTLDSSYAAGPVYEDGVWSDEDSPIPISSKDAAWGSRIAPVTMVVFSDYQCPYCAKFEETLSDLRSKYGPGKLRIVWKNNPLPGHKNARSAALAGETVFRLAGNRVFWKWHEVAFKNQDALTPEHFREWAAQAGVDAARFQAALEHEEFGAKIDADLAVGKTDGVSGTPASFVNGVFLNGLLPVESFTAVIDEQLAAAKDAAAHGVRADKLYVRLSTENRAKSPATADKEAEAEKQRAAEEAKVVHKVAIGSAPARGPLNAPVTIVVFSDFQCPFCAKLAPTLDELDRAYPGKLRFVWKNAPLPSHSRAEPCAELALEARAEKGDKGFWAAHDLLFKNQAKLSDEDLAGYAKELGLDANGARIAIQTHKYKVHLALDSNQADDLETSGTPNLFINGRHVIGAQPVESFKPLIDEELQKAASLVTTGVKPERVYDEIMKGAKEPPPPEKKTIDAPGPDEARIGGSHAKVVMIEHGDFECPFCQRASEVLADVQKTYGDKLAIVWRHKPLPMHTEAPLAAEAAEEARAQKGNPGFWQMADALFKAQGREDGLKQAGLDRIAENLGLDMKRFDQALETHVHKPLVDAESQAADAAGVSGTPAFVVGSVQQGKLSGYFINGVQPFEKMRRLIDKAFKDAGEKIPTR